MKSGDFDPNGLVCRLCADSSETLIKIFPENLKIRDDIVQFTDLTVSSDDELPQFVCETCTLELRQCCTFQQKCEESYRSLQKMVCEIKTYSEGDLGDNAMVLINVDLDSEWAVCRLCLESSPSLSGIFSEGDQVQHDLLRLANVTLAKDDGLPQLICEVCLAELKRCSHFKLNCQLADDKLRDLSKNEIKVKIEAEPKMDKKHISTAHVSGKPYQCAICEKYLNTRQGYREHMRAHEKGRQYVCEHCGRAFTLAVTLRKHLRIHEGLLPYQCEHCPYRSRVRHGLTLHLRKHTGERPYACPHCDSTFTASSGLSAHLLVHNLEGPRTMYQCTECPKTYISQRSLLDHISTLHDKVKRHKCEICGKRLSTGWTLIQHLKRIHNVQPTKESKAIQKFVKPLKVEIKEELTTLLCDQCTQVFHTEGELETHIQAQHRARRCNVCQKTFNNPRTYRTHMRVHKVGRSYICEHCGQAFYYLASLTKHRLTHKRVRRFQCSHCPYRAHMKHLLAAHMRTHSNRGEFPCSHCSSTFPSFKARRNHTLQSHPVYQCRECERTYTKIEALLEHITAMHRQVIIVDNQSEEKSDTGEDELKVQPQGTEKLKGCQPDEIYEKSCNEKRASIENKGRVPSESLSQRTESERAVESICKQAPHVLQSSSKAPARYKCVDCPKVYKKLRNLTSHVATVHREVYECNICQERLSDKKPHMCRRRSHKSTLNKKEGHKRRPSEDE